MFNVIKTIGSLLGLMTIFILISIYVTGNFYQLDKAVYRSGQLYFYNLPYFLKKYKIKTIINLTQGSLTDPDYLDEIKIAHNLDVKLINFKMSARSYLDFQKTTKLVTILKAAEQPILIHCFGGSDRTALASALYSYAIMGNSVAVAKKQFSIQYGHLPSFRPKVIAMDKSFDNYVKHKINFND